MYTARREKTKEQLKQVDNQNPHSSAALVYKQVLEKRTGEQLATWRLSTLVLLIILLLMLFIGVYLWNVPRVQQAIRETVVEIAQGDAQVSEQNSTSGLRSSNVAGSCHHVVDSTMVVDSGEQPYDGNDPGLLCLDSSCLQVVDANSRFASRGSPYWNGTHGGTDIVAFHGSDVFLPVSMEYVSSGFYNQDGFYGHYKIFTTEYQGEQVNFYFGHMMREDKDNVETVFRAGQTYSMGTRIGQLTDGRGSMFTIPPHVHIQIETSVSADGQGDIDFEEWWKQTCEGPGTASVQPGAQGNQVPSDHPLNNSLGEGYESQVILHESELNAEEIRLILQELGNPVILQESPQLPEHIVQRSTETGISPAVFIAFWHMESNIEQHSGAVPARKNPGNINPPGGLSNYASWEEGVNAWYDLISGYYLYPSVGESQLVLPIFYDVPAEERTVAHLIPTYAPVHENDTAQYIKTVDNIVFCFRDADRSANQDWLYQCIQNPGAMQ